MKKEILILASASLICSGLGFITGIVYSKKKNKKQTKYIGDLVVTTDANNNTEYLYVQLECPPNDLQRITDGVFQIVHA